MGWQVAPGQQAAVHFRVQRLDAAVTDFGESGDFTDTDGLHALLFQQTLRTTRGDDFPAEAGKGGGERRNAGLVAYAD